MGRYKDYDRGSKRGGYDDDQKSDASFGEARASGGEIGKRALNGILKYVTLMKSR